MAQSPLYLRQIELGPMQNFVYLIGDQASRECVVVDPAWEIDGIADVARRHAAPARWSPTRIRTTWAATSSATTSRAWRSCSPSTP